MTKRPFVFSKCVLYPEKNLVCSLNYSQITLKKTNSIYYTVFTVYVKCNLYNKMSVNTLLHGLDRGWYAGLKKPCCHLISACSQ